MVYWNPELKTHATVRYHERLSISMQDAMRAAAEATGCEDSGMRVNFPRNSPPGYREMETTTMTASTSKMVPPMDAKNEKGKAKT